MSDNEGPVTLPVGLIGISVEVIAVGKHGWCLFPIGAWDPHLQRREWVRRKIRAIEDIREKREVIIADEQEGCKEHTPVELSYQTRIGPYQRVTEDYPLPTSMGGRGIFWTESVLITATADTELISAPGTGKSLRIHGICFSNKHAVSVDVALSQNTDGTKLFFRHIIAGNGGNVDLNLTDMCWDLDENTALQYYAQAAYVGGVLVSIGYTIEQ